MYKITPHSHNNTSARVRTKARVQEFRADRDCLFRDMPLAVLVDKNTSGSGEWIAAALQDNRAAVVIGEPTAGRCWTVIILCR